MFALAAASSTHLYNFYLNEKFETCKGHSGRIVNIDWFEDDSGFADCCNQGQISFYDLQ